MMGCSTYVCRMQWIHYQEIVLLQVHYSETPCYDISPSILFMFIYIYIYIYNIQRQRSVSLLLHNKKEPLAACMAAYGGKSYGCEDTRIVAVATIIAGNTEPPTLHRSLLHLLLTCYTRVNKSEQIRTRSKQVRLGCDRLDQAKLGNSSPEALGF